MNTKWQHPGWIIFAIGLVWTAIVFFASRR